MLNTIKMNFDFIKDKGYKRKVCSKNMDYEVYYIKQNNKILVAYQLSVPLDLTGANIKELLKHSFYSIDIIIKINEKIENILESSLFSNEERCNLKQEISNNKNMLEKQIVIYANFLKNKIDFL